jgi:hypothetical protein
MGPGREPMQRSKSELDLRSFDDDNMGVAPPNPYQLAGENNQKDLFLLFYSVMSEEEKARVQDSYQQKNDQKVTAWIKEYDCIREISRRIRLFSAGISEDALIETFLDIMHKTKAVCSIKEQALNEISTQEGRQR